MRKLEIHHSPYIHEMNENKFGLQMKIIKWDYYLSPIDERNKIQTQF